MILDEPLEATSVSVPAGVQGVLALAAVGVLLFGLAPSSLISAAQHAASALQ